MTKQEIIERLQELKSLVSRQRFSEAIDAANEAVEKIIPAPVFDFLLKMTGMTYEPETQQLISVQVPIIYDKLEIYHGQMVEVLRDSKGGAVSIGFQPDNPEEKLVIAGELMDHVCEACRNHTCIDSGGWRGECKCWFAQEVEEFQKYKEEYRNGHDL